MCFDFFFHHTRVYALQKSNSDSTCNAKIYSKVVVDYTSVFTTVAFSLVNFKTFTLCKA